MEKICNYNGVDSAKVVEKLSGMFGNPKGEQKKVKDAVEVAFQLADKVDNGTFIDIYQIALDAVLNRNLSMYYDICFDAKILIEKFSEDRYLNEYTSSSLEDEILKLADTFASVANMSEDEINQVDKQFRKLKACTPMDTDESLSEANSIALVLMDIFLSEEAPKRTELELALSVEVKKDINHMTAEEVQDSLYKRTEPDMDNFKDFDTLKVADYIISHSSEYFDYHPNALTNNMIDIVKAYVRDINLLGICIANHIKNLDMKILNGMEGLMDGFSAEYPEVSCLWNTRNNLHEYINSQRHAQINLYNALTDIMMRYNMLSDLAKDIPEKKIVQYRIINGKKFRLDDTINREDIACRKIIKSVFGYRNGDCNGFSFGREELERAERQLGY